MKRRIRPLEQFEDRICLTLTAALSVNDLVGGTADGAVEILALDEDTYQVSDAGNIVATVDGVTDDIRIVLAGESAVGGNQVTLNLAGQTVDSIMASLGIGENSFVVQGGTATSLRYIGGSGVDNVELAEDFTLAGTVTTFGACGSYGSVSISLGAGDNNLAVNSQVTGSLGVSGGAGADKVTVGESASIAGKFFASLGAGDNSVDVLGEILGSLDVKGGDGSDAVTIAGSAGSASLNLGAGANSLSLTGALTGGLNYQGGAGNDAVAIAEGASVGGTVKTLLGAGDNTVDVAGSIGGDFVVRSANAADVVTIADTAVISGTQDVQPGVEAITPTHGPRFGGRPHFGFGPFGRR